MYTQWAKVKEPKAEVHFFFLNCCSIIFLATPHSIQGPTSPTRDRSCALCSGGVESEPLDLQGCPRKEAFKKGKFPITC